MKKLDAYTLLIRFVIILLASLIALTIYLSAKLMNTPLTTVSDGAVELNEIILDCYEKHSVTTRLFDTLYPGRFMQCLVEQGFEITYRGEPIIINLNGD